MTTSQITKNSLEEFDEKISNCSLPNCFECQQVKSHLISHTIAVLEGEIEFWKEKCYNEVVEHLQEQLNEIKNEKTFSQKK